MPTLTGVVWINWLIIAAATVAACSTIYYKALRPLVSGLKRLRAFFDKVENLFDMGDELAPAVRNSLFATQAQLVKGQDDLAAGHQQIMAVLVETNDRIDAHMNAEEESLGHVAESVSAINVRLDAIEAAAKQED